MYNHSRCQTNMTKSKTKFITSMFLWIYQLVYTLFIIVNF